MKFHHEFTVPMGIDDAWRMVGDAEKLGARLPGTRLRHVISRDEARRVAVIDAETVGANGKAGLRGTVTVGLREKAAKETVVTLDTNLKLGATAASMGASRASAFGSQFVGNLSQGLADQARRRTGAGRTSTTPAAADAGEVPFVVTTPPGRWAAGGLRMTRPGSAGTASSAPEPSPSGRDATRETTSPAVGASGGAGTAASAPSSTAGEESRTRGTDTPGNAGADKPGHGPSAAGTAGSGTAGTAGTAGAPGGSGVASAAGRAREALRNPQVAAAAGLAAGALTTLAARRRR